jgi:hypothetical protein
MGNFSRINHLELDHALGRGDILLQEGEDELVVVVEVSNLVGPFQGGGFGIE